MNWIESISTYITTLSNGNIVISGILTAWLLGVGSYLLKNLPKQILESIIRQSTTTITFDDSGDGYGFVQFTKFMSWLNNRGIRWVRNFHLTSVHDSTWAYDRQKDKDKDIGYNKDSPMMLNTGEGTHFLYQDRMLLKISIKHDSPTNSLGASRPVRTVHITCLTRDLTRVHNILNRFVLRNDPEKLKIYHFSDSSWDLLCHMEPRNLNTVIIESNLKSKLLLDINSFINDRDWYRSRGLKYAMTTLLHGVPGTGKTTIIQALAYHYGYNIGIINASLMSDGKFQKSIASLPERTVLVIEDIDSIPCLLEEDAGLAVEHFQYRQLELENKLKEGEYPHSSDSPRSDIVKTDEDICTSKKPSKPFSLLTRSGFLNALDGISTPEGLIIYLTTNYIERIAQNALRAGRVDHKYEVHPMLDIQVREYIKMSFPGVEPPADITFKEICGCDLEHIFVENKTNSQKFIESIPHYPKAYDAKLDTSNNSAQ